MHMALWLLVLVTLAVDSVASRNQCVIFDKPEELWAVSDLVFLGTVVTKSQPEPRASTSRLRSPRSGSIVYGRANRDVGWRLAVTHLSRMENSI